MDQHFKILQAWEEVDGLNTKIPQLITFIRDEQMFLATMEEHLQADNPLISHQIGLHCHQHATYGATTETLLFAQVFGSPDIWPGQ
jgi:hypothetical protein